MMNLTSYDAIIVNTSAGKDSQAMLDIVVKMAREQGCLDRVISVHCDLGRVEWADTAKLAEKQARMYGVRYEMVERTQGDLLDNVVQKHKSIVRRNKRSAKTGELQVAWPDPQNRWCTSEHKTAQVTKLMTKLVEEFCMATWGRTFSKGSDMPRPMKILSCLGIRILESDKRGQRLNKLIEQNGEAIEYKTSQSNGKRVVDEWNPIATMTTAQVWECIDASGVPYHPAYDLNPGDRKGMSRLSCCFCMMASKRDLVLAARRNPELAQDYVSVERLTGKTFLMDRSMTDVLALANSAEGDRLLATEDAECSACAA